MIPELSHIESSEGYNYWVTTDAVVGTALYLEAIDLELGDSLEALMRLRNCLKQLDPKITVRIRLDRSESLFLDGEFPRKEAVSKLGFIASRLIISFDYVGSFEVLQEILARVRKNNQTPERWNAVLSAVKLFEQQGFKLTCMSEDELKKLFIQKFRHWRSGITSIETGTEKIGIIRVEKPPFKDFKLSNWVQTIEALPVPYTLHFSFQRLDEASSKMFLERRLKQVSSGRDISSKIQENATVDVIRESFETGAQLFHSETLIELRRRGDESLAKAMESTGAGLSLFSDTYVETFGVAPSFAATLPGNAQHLSFLEVEEGLSGLLPVFQNGEVKEFKGKPGRSLTLLRKNNSLFHFDLFDPSYNVFNVLIAGTSGRGKSVLLGLLTTSLLNDSDVRIIKLDVGGSHSKECELFGGREFQLSLEKGSGINPFEILTVPDAGENDKLAVISKFLGVLVSEQGELLLSKSLRSEIELAVREYIDMGPRDPSVDDFFLKIKNFPRRELLSRWVKGGLYEKAFASGNVGNQETTESLRYYNFSQIFQAADPEFAQAGVAAVLAQFNIEMLKANGKRLVLICDEVPFFIKSCFDFFKFSTANVRKYGHAVVLSAQLSSDFIVGGDSGIIENSPQRFLFSIDGDEETFQERFGLTANHIATMRSLRSVVGKYSEVLFKEPEGARRLAVRITPEEYWRLTTSRLDKEKLMNLMDAVPGLLLREAINCLSHEN